METLCVLNFVSICNHENPQLQIKSPTQQRQINEKTHCVWANTESLE